MIKIHSLKPISLNKNPESIRCHDCSVNVISSDIHISKKNSVRLSDFGSVQLHILRNLTV